MLNIAVKIKIEMLKVGISAVAIARKAGVDRSAISHVIAGRHKSKRLRRAIADALGLPYKEVWGEDKKRAT